MLWAQGYAIGSAALVSLALFGAYVTRAEITTKDSSILAPEVRCLGFWGSGRGLSQAQGWNRIDAAVRCAQHATPQHALPVCCAASLCRWARHGCALRKPDCRAPFD